MFCLISIIMNYCFGYIILKKLIPQQIYHSPAGNMAFLKIKVDFGIMHMYKSINLGLKY